MNRHLTRFLAVVTLLLIGPVTATVAAAGGNLSGYAWSSNAGWINFNPTHGGGATVFTDHLEGYAWAENIGWVRLGSYSGGGGHTYANNAAGNYGVNRTPDGSLSGYAWSSSAGWINFNPTHGGVSIDPVTGSLSGWAWAENIGWLHLAAEGGSYGVTTGGESGRRYYLPLIFKS